MSHHGYRQWRFVAASGPPDPADTSRTPDESRLAAGGGMMHEPLLTAAQVAAWLNVPVGTIYAWRYRGDGPPGIKVGRHVRFRREDVDAWLTEKRKADRTSHR